MCGRNVDALPFSNHQCPISIGCTKSQDKVARLNLIHMRGSDTHSHTLYLHLTTNRFPDISGDGPK